MRRDIDSVQIKEPPLKQLEKKTSCARRSCAAGLLGTIAIAAILYYLAISSETPETRELKEIPANLSDLPLYDARDIGKITRTSVSGNSVIRGIFRFVSGGRMFPSDKAQSERYEIEWTDLSAKPQFLYEYYRHEFIKAGFDVANESAGNHTWQFSFSKHGLNGSLFIRAAHTTGIDDVLLTIVVPSET